jgi:hypothetical protein
MNPHREELIDAFLDLAVEAITTGDLMLERYLEMMFGLAEIQRQEASHA